MKYELRFLDREGQIIDAICRNRKITVNNINPPLFAISWELLKDDKVIEKHSLFGHLSKTS